MNEIIAVQKSALGVWDEKRLLLAENGISKTDRSHATFQLQDGITMNDNHKIKQ